MIRWLLLLALLLPSPAFAWGRYGHETVAQIALLTVQPSTRAEINRLLAVEGQLDTPECPVRTLEDASVWADCLRGYRDRFSYTFPWHYQNVDICRPFDLSAACKDGNCVSAQIERNAKLLADRSLPVRERLAALAFVTHFVGDMHMPLHSGDRGDRGGNDVAAAYGLIEGRTNLHSAWDGFLAERSISTPPGGPKGLLQPVSAEERAAIAAGSVTDWAREAWQLSRDQAYASVLGDPCGPKPEGRARIEEATTQRLIPTVRTQILRAGLRLSRLLDEALG